MESVIHHEVKSIICGCSEVIHCEPEQAGLKTAGPHITSAQDLDAPWESGIIYLRITVSAKVNTQLKIMFKMTLLKIYCFTPFLPSSACLSLHSAPSFLPIFLCFLGKVQSLSSLLPFICFHRDHMNVQKKECVFVTHILPQKVCVRRAKRAKLLTCGPCIPTYCAVRSHSFQNSPPPSFSFFSLHLPLYLSPRLYPFDLHFSTTIFLSISLCSRKSNQAGSVLTDC